MKNFHWIIKETLELFGHSVLPGIFVLVLAVGLAIWFSHNLVTNGKSGWSWFLICLVGAIIGILLKVAVSLFVEVSSADPIPRDWDED